MVPRISAVVHLHFHSELNFRDLSRVSSSRVINEYHTKMSNISSPPCPRPLSAANKPPSTSKSRVSITLILPPPQISDKIISSLKKPVLPPSLHRRFSVPMEPSIPFYDIILNQMETMNNIDDGISTAESSSNPISMLFRASPGGFSGGWMSGYHRSFSNFNSAMLFPPPDSSYDAQKPPSNRHLFSAASNSFKLNPNSESKTSLSLMTTRICSSDSSLSLDNRDTPNLFSTRGSIATLMWTSKPNEAFGATKDDIFLADILDGTRKFEFMLSNNIHNVRRNRTRYAILGCVSQSEFGFVLRARRSEHCRDKEVAGWNC